MPLNLSLSFYMIVCELVLLLIITALTQRRITFSAIATNGVVVMMASATLLWDQRPLGFGLIAYATLLLTASVREYTEEELKKEEWLGKMLKIIGHYGFVGAVLVIVLILEYVI